jgi:predicted nucleotidyltransferase
MFIRDFSAMEDSDGLIFTARGNHHNQDNIMSCLIYVPTNLPSNRIKSPNKRYFKIPDQTGYGLLSSNMPQKLYTNPITQETYPVVKSGDIVNIIDPINALEDVLNNKKYNHLEEFVLHLENIGIPRDCLGIFGSIMLDFEQINFHDFDMIIYGIENKDKYMNSRGEFFSNLGYESVSDQELEDITRNIALKQNPIGYDLMHPVSINRQLSCMIKYGELFSVKFGYLPEETYNPLIFPPKQEITLEATVIDDSRGFFLPYTYIVNDGESDFTIQTYDFAYFSAAFNGQKVKIRGIERETTELNLITLQQPHHYISPILK